ncbi:DMT family transporter [Mycobacterium saskatchewanense]|uniref:DMT family transporter n=1 Tax=Mycobacterium saskatchewanense TaxID=220927 RepID=UPI001E489908|nr:DMT family transporter [Mycobacterium saskatchewanense]
MSLLIDHFGWLRVDAHPISLGRCLAGRSWSAGSRSSRSSEAIAKIWPGIRAGLTWRGARRRPVWPACTQSSSLNG